MAEPGLGMPGWLGEMGQVEGMDDQGVISDKELAK